MGAPAAKDIRPDGPLKTESRLTMRVPMVDGRLLAVARGDVEPSRDLAEAADVAENDDGFLGPRDDDDPFGVLFPDFDDPSGLLPRDPFGVLIALRRGLDED